MTNIKPYYDTGKQFFCNGCDVYINKYTEPSTHHFHAHDFIEITYVVEGSGVHQLGELEYPVSRGDLFIINYDIPHEFRSHEEIGALPLVVYNCIFKPGFLDLSLTNCRDFSKLLQHLYLRSLFPSEYNCEKDIKILNGCTAEIEKIFEKIYHEYELKDLGYVEMLRTYVIELLITIFRTYAKANLEYCNMNTVPRKMLQQALLYMQENYKEEVSFEELYHLTFFSRSHFSKLFKESTGMTVLEYIQKLRIDEACSLLKTSQERIIDIAMSVGYRDIKFFNQVFKRLTGKTPSEYRKILKRNSSA